MRFHCPQTNDLLLISSGFPNERLADRPDAPAGPREDSNFTWCEAVVIGPACSARVHHGLVQIADHTGIDLKRAVGRKLVKNSKKHHRCASRPAWLPRGHSGRR